MDVGRPHDLGPERVFERVSLAPVQHEGVNEVVFVRAHAEGMQPGIDPLAGGQHAGVNHCFRIGRAQLGEGAFDPLGAGAVLLGLHRSSPWA